MGRERGGGEQSEEDIRGVKAGMDGARLMHFSHHKFGCW